MRRICFLAALVVMVAALLLAVNAGDRCCTDRAILLKAAYSAADRLPEGHEARVELERAIELTDR